MTASGISRRDPLAKYRNRIICGDCLEIMRGMPPESVDLVVTSPPYNLLNSTGNGLQRSRNGSLNSCKWKNAKIADGYAGYGDSMEYGEYVRWQRECLSEMMRLIPEDGAIFYNHKWRVQNGLIQDRKEILDGFPVRQIIIWRRSGGINFNPGYFLPTYEVVYMICKPKFRLLPGSNALGDVWDIKQERGSPHPAPFPIELPARIIASTYARTVLDPFAGSGTTAVAAKNLGIDYIGIDISEEYCRIAEERILRGSAERKATKKRKGAELCC